MPFFYEKLTLPWTQPTVERKYTPDFVLYNGIVVETKGRWVTADRQKVKAVRAQYPLLDLRIVFSNANCRISKTSRTTYAMFCEKHGIKYASKRIPESWTREPTSWDSFKIITRLSGALFGPSRG